MCSSCFSSSALETATGRRSTLPTPQSPAPKTTPQPKEALIPEGAPDQTVIRFEDEALLAGSDPDVKKDSEFDWWSKFYLSAKDEERSQPEYGQQGFDKLMVSTVCTVVVGVHRCMYCRSRVSMSVVVRM